MNDKLQVYTIINNHIFSEGIKNLIIKQVYSEANIVQIEDLKTLIEKDFIKKDNSEILIYETPEFSNKAFNHLLHLISINPDLKILLITTNIKIQDLKRIFEIGVSGIINKDSLPEQFVNFVIKVLKGDKVLSPEYRNLIVECFLNNSEKKTETTELKTNKEKLKETVVFLDELTTREKEILCFICDGKNTREISESLFISLHTVETHRRKILKKLDVKNTASMVKVAILNNLYTLE